MIAGKPCLVTLKRIRRVSSGRLLVAPAQLPTITDSYLNCFKVVGGVLYASFFLINASQVSYDRWEPVPSDA